jgi:ABC-2 type transport system permease protein
MITKNDLRTFRFAAWLGWQAESNWTDPYLFSIYSIVRPLASTLLIVIMYWFVQAPTDIFYFMFIGVVFYMYIFNVMLGVSWIIHEDREHYQTLKYIYIMPAKFYFYMFGRSVSRVFVLGIPLDIGSINFPMLLLVLFIGLVGIAAFGVALSGIALITARHRGAMHEALAGFFYLFCGVIFPLSVLPAWGQAIGHACTSHNILARAPQEGIDRLRRCDACFRGHGVHLPDSVGLDRAVRRGVDPDIQDGRASRQEQRNARHDDRILR